MGLIDWFIEWLIDDWLIDGLMDWSIYWLWDWLIALFSERLVCGNGRPLCSSSTTLTGSTTFFLFPYLCSMGYFTAIIGHSLILLAALRANLFLAWREINTDKDKLRPGWQLWCGSKGHKSPKKTKYKIVVITYEYKFLCTC